MVTLLFRLAMIILGIVVVAEAFLPLSTARDQVERKTLTFDLQSPSVPWNPATIYFAGGNAGSCRFGLATYARVAAGDQVSIERTRLTKSCVSISRDGEVIEGSRYWKLGCILFGLTILAVAMFGQVDKGRWWRGSIEL